MVTMDTDTTTPEQFGIKEAAEFLNRKPATIRSWERPGKLPKHLLPHRSERGWRFWTKEQLEEIRDEWMPLNAVPGSGFRKALEARGIKPPDYDPSEEEQKRILDDQRAPRPRAAAA